MKLRSTLIFLTIAACAMAIYAQSMDKVMSNGLEETSAKIDKTQPSTKAEPEKQAANIAVFPDSAAVITNTGSTNREGYEIVMLRSGHLFYTVANQTVDMNMPMPTVKRFFSDLKSAGPLSQLPIQPTCLKSASFGSSTYLFYKGQQSPDLSCPADDRGINLRADIRLINEAVNTVFPNRGFNTITE